MQRFVKTDTGSSHLASVIDFGGMGSANQVRIADFQLHLSGAATATNTLTITKRSKRGSAYDAVIFTQAMVSVADIVQQWDPPLAVNGKDRISVAWTNDTASFKTWGFTLGCEG